MTAGAGLVVTGDGSSGSPFVSTVKNRQALANPVRNASMAVAQRGTSISISAATTPFTLDGWKGFRNTASAGMTVSQQTALGDTQGSGYAARIQRDNGNAVLDGLFFHQSITTVESRRFAGRTVTFSFRARKGANFSAASNVLTGQLITGTGTDQTVSGGFTGYATVVFVAATLTSGWVTYSGTVALGSGVTQLAVQFTFTPVGTAGAADYAEVKDVRIDEGSYAQEHVPVRFATDLAECQRFLYRQGGVGNNDAHGIGMVSSATVAWIWVKFPVRMRGVPTLTVAAAGGVNVSDGTVSPASTAIALNGAVTQTRDGVIVGVTCGGGGMTVGRACLCYVGGTPANGAWDFSAEI